jgi:Tfp pilus assembly protein PilX
LDPLQLSKAEAKERRREEDIRGLASEKEAACNQKLSEAHAKIDTLRMQLSQAAKVRNKGTCVVEKMSQSWASVFLY